MKAFLYRSFLLTVLLVTGDFLIGYAHEGHGIASDGISHYVFSAEHLVPMLLSFGFIALMTYFFFQKLKQE